MDHIRLTIRQLCVGNNHRACRKVGASICFLKSLVGIFFPCCCQMFDSRKSRSSKKQKQGFFNATDDVRLVIHTHPHLKTRYASHTLIPSLSLSLSLSPIPRYIPSLSHSIVPFLSHTYLKNALTHSLLSHTSQNTLCLSLSETHTLSLNHWYTLFLSPIGTYHLSLTHKYSSFTCRYTLSLSFIHPY